MSLYRSTARLFATSSCWFSIALWIIATKFFRPSVMFFGGWIIGSWFTVFFSLCLLGKRAKKSLSVMLFSMIESVRSGKESQPLHTILSIPAIKVIPILFFFGLYTVTHVSIHGPVVQVT